MQVNKGSATVILLVVLVVVVAAVSVYFAFLKKPGEVAVSPTPTPTATANPTANWKTYNSQNFGFVFKYPNEYVVKEDANGVQIYDSTKDYYGNLVYLINFSVQTTNKTLDSAITDKAKEFSISQATPTTINGLPAYESVDLGMTTQYAVFLKNSSNLIEIQFRTSNSGSSSNEGLQKYKAAMTTNQKLILSTLKFTK